MKIVLLIIVVFWFVSSIFLIIAAGLRNMAENQRRKARFTTWEGWTLSPAALRNYDKLCMLISMHAYLLQEISRIIQEINLSSDYCGWKRKKLMELSGLAEENARSYKRLSQQTGFRFSLKDWVPDGEERLPRELPFPIQPILDC